MCFVYYNQNYHHKDKDTPKKGQSRLQKANQIIINFIWICKWVCKGVSTGARQASQDNRVDRMTRISLKWGKYPFMDECGSCSTRFNPTPLLSSPILPANISVLLLGVKWKEVDDDESVPLFVENETVHLLTLMRWVLLNKHHIVCRK